MAGVAAAGVIGFGWLVFILQGVRRRRRRPSDSGIEAWQRARTALTSRKPRDG